MLYHSLLDSIRFKGLLEADEGHGTALSTNDRPSRMEQIATAVRVFKPEAGSLRLVRRSGAPSSEATKSSEAETGATKGQ